MIGECDELENAMRSAAALLEVDRDEEAAEVLDRASPQLSRCKNRELVLRFAAMCHDWASSASEEVALRVALSLDEDVETLRGLLDLLQQRLNDLEGEPHRAAAEECLRLGERVISFLATSRVSLPIAEARRTQALRHVDLARHGQPGHASLAVGLLEGYLTWLRSGDGVPGHWSIRNQAADVEVDLAEANLLAGNRDAAIVLLDHATTTMQRAGLPSWMTERAFALLEQAMA